MTTDQQNEWILTNEELKATQSMYNFDEVRYQKGSVGLWFPKKLLDQLRRDAVDNYVKGKVTWDKMREIEAKKELLDELQKGIDNCAEHDHTEGTWSFYNYDNVNTMLLELRAKTLGKNVKKE